MAVALRTTDFHLIVIQQSHLQVQPLSFIENVIKCLKCIILHVFLALLSSVLVDK